MYVEIKVMPIFRLRDLVTYNGLLLEKAFSLTKGHCPDGDMLTLMNYGISLDNIIKARNILLLNRLLDIIINRTAYYHMIEADISSDEELECMYHVFITLDMIDQADSLLRSRENSGNSIIEQQTTAVSINKDHEEQPLDLNCSNDTNYDTNPSPSIFFAGMNYNIIPDGSF